MTNLFYKLCAVTLLHTYDYLLDNEVDFGQETYEVFLDLRRSLRAVV